MRKSPGALRPTPRRRSPPSAEARRQAEITARYEAQARREAEEIAARGRRSAEERQARLASVAQLDARKLELAAKQEMLAKAYDRAMERLTSLPDGEYVGLLAGLAAEASSTGREEVILSQKDRARYGSRWSPRPTRGWETAI